MQPILIKEASFAALDFESTGERAGEVSLPIQVGIVSLTGLMMKEPSFYRSYLHSERPITWAAQQVHGICDHDLKNAPSMRSLWPQFQHHLGNRYLVAHAHGTERRFLRTFPMHSFGPWIDTLTLSRKMAPGLPSYQLSKLAFHFGLVEKAVTLLPDFRWHEALSDALASLLLLLHFIEQEDLANEPISLLTTSH